MVIDMGDKSAEDVRILSPSLFQPHELRTEEGLEWGSLPEKVWVLGPDLRTLYVFNPKGGQFRQPSEGEVARLLVKRIR